MEDILVIFIGYIKDKISNEKFLIWGGLGVIS